MIYEWSKGKSYFQRLKPLKEDNIWNLKRFFDEIVDNINLIKSNYQKSGDEKEYLAGIKNIVGNAINDDKLIEFAKLDEVKFKNEIKHLYNDKKLDRVKILGESENNSLEKKIFLQIIDFSWRSHLQYLEQLRQLLVWDNTKRSTLWVQKEAFILFESLLIKIKA